MRHALTIGEDTHELWLAREADGYRLHAGERALRVALEAGVLRVGDSRHPVTVAVDGDLVHVHLDGAAWTTIISGPPTGIVSVGGYRFVMRELQDLVARAGPMNTLAALPDTFAGHRLAGSADDRAGMREALLTYGANPLIVRAFRERADRSTSG